MLVLNVFIFQFYYGLKEQLFIVLIDPAQKYVTVRVFNAFTILKRNEFNVIKPVIVAV